MRVLFCFFFFKQKTAYEMRISDWSSDVCSSDLIAQRRQQGGIVGVGFKPDLGLAKAPRDMLGRALRIRIEQPGFLAYLQGRFENARGFVDIALRLLDAGPGQGNIGQSTFVGFQVAPDSLEAFRAARSEEHTSELQSLMRIS